LRQKRVHVKDGKLVFQHLIHFLFNGIGSIDSAVNHVAGCSNPNSGSQRVGRGGGHLFHDRVQGQCIGCVFRLDLLVWIGIARNLPDDSVNRPAGFRRRAFHGDLRDQFRHRIDHLTRFLVIQTHKPAGPQGLIQKAGHACKIGFHYM
jgi:hypothetical protein